MLLSDYASVYASGQGVNAPGTFQTPTQIKAGEDRGGQLLN